ncbi:MAG: UDPGP type 1 family protein [Oscillospiraceae bacterium]|nr:UDPGP type 1 family protein [Oscillospiraceae bacterium]MBQ4310953.1 UDPGP type 1 family protein [Oscillospiraceae bacterium]
MNYEEARAKMSAIGQEHVFKYYDELSDEGKAALIKQVEETDFAVLDRIGSGAGDKRGVFTPLAAMQRSEIEAREKELHDAGVKAIKEGKTAALLLAGGMGTRLGSDNPKGMFDIGLTKPVYIFERIISNLLDVVNETGTWIRLFIMTSEKNHDATVKFLKEKNFFGYKEDRIVFFKQDMAPACDFNGKLYMEAKDRISTSPNGNAGWYSSLCRAGLDRIFTDEGIEWIDIFAVDNVLQRICDPCFVGATVLADVSVGAKVVRKAAPDEKVGVMCLEDGRPSIVEYYELSDDMMNARDENGEPAYNYGVILNYLFRVSDLASVKDDNMPLHVVKKKIPYIDENGNAVKPAEPNGFKFEQLVLDMIHQLSTCLPYEVIREKEFAPIKNPTGIDSVESARELLKKNNIEL